MTLPLSDASGHRVELERLILDDLICAETMGNGLFVLNMPRRWRCLHR